jgi:hypothetical protein
LQEALVQQASHSIVLLEVVAAEQWVLVEIVVQKEVLELELVVVEDCYTVVFEDKMN